MTASHRPAAALTGAGLVPHAVNSVLDPKYHQNMQRTRILVARPQPAVAKIAIERRSRHLAGVLAAEDHERCRADPSDGSEPFRPPRSRRVSDRRWPPTAWSASPRGRRQRRSDAPSTPRTDRDSYRSRSFGAPTRMAGERRRLLAAVQPNARRPSRGAGARAVVAAHRAMVARSQVFQSGEPSMRMPPS